MVIYRMRNLQFVMEIRSAPLDVAPLCKKRLLLHVVLKNRNVSKLLFFFNSILKFKFGFISHWGGYNGITTRYCPLIDPDGNVELLLREVLLDKIDKNLRVTSKNPSLFSGNSGGGNDGCCCRDGIKTTARLTVGTDHTITRESTFPTNNRLYCATKKKFQEKIISK